MRYLIVILSFLYCVPAWSQLDDTLIRQRVLETNIVDSVFVFGKWDKEKGVETDLKYLGQVQTTNGRTLKIMTSMFLWGHSHRATNRILIFNEKNQYLGGFDVHTTFDLPVNLENGFLIFKNTGKDECDKTLTTKIDFKKGIPNQIFLKCEGENGDLYNFSAE
jgi:hypothetical protein